MRLICGLFQLDGSTPDITKVSSMAEQMAANYRKNVGREPALGLWQGGPVALGLLDFGRALTTAPKIPDSLGQRLVADLRIDSFDPDRLGEGLDLGSSIGLPEVDVPSGAAIEDEHLLRFLAPDPVARTGEVLGDFAFALWDEPAERLVCGRDIFGIRPLAYLYEPGRLFAFASFPDAIYRSGFVSDAVDRQALARRVAHVVRLEDTLHAPIKRLPPAHTLVVSRKGLALHRYWQPELHQIGRRRVRPEQAADEVRRRMEQAVASCLTQQGEVGAHLSGGLDSSSLAILAIRRLREQGRKLYAYSFLDRRPGDPLPAGPVPEDETEFVRAVLAQEPGIEWEPVLPPSNKVLQEPLDADTMQSQSADNPEHVVCRSAASYGVERIFSGWGGDECITFNGRGALAEMFLAGHWLRLLRESKAMARERGRTLRSVLWHEVAVWLQERATHRIRPAAQWIDAAMLSFFVPSVCAELSRQQTVQMVPSARENRWRLLMHGHLTERAENWAKIGAQYGMDFVFPMLDRRVVEYGLSLPSELFLRGGFRRRIYRDAMVGVLPEMVRQRHEKYQPFPSRMLEKDAQRRAALERMADYERCEALKDCFDLKLLRAALEGSLDQNEALRRVAASLTPMTILRVVQGVEYLYQQSCKQPR